MDLDLNTILDDLRMAARSVGAEVTSPWFYLQLGLILTAAGLAFDDGAHRHEHQRRLTRNEVTHTRLVAAIDPAPGVEGHEVEDGMHTERAQALPALVAHAVELFHIDHGQRAE